MHYFLYPQKDALITNQPNQMLKNTGLDEVIEIEKTIQPKSCTGDVSGSVLSRTLIQFDLTEISASVSSGKIPPPSFTLNLRCVEALELSIDYTIYAFPVAQPWVMGSGYRFDNQQVPDGVNWKFRDGMTTVWYPELTLSNCGGGGVWYIESGSLQSGSISNHPSGSLVANQPFKYQSADVRMDVNNIVYAWMSGSIPNYGFLLAHGGENDNQDHGKLRFFSKESNTIYQPYIDVTWDDSVFNTGSLTGTGSLDPLNIVDAIVSLPKLRKEYRSGDTVRIDVVGRQKYPQKTFTNYLSDYIEPKYLPQESYYLIRDAESELIVVPADIGTRLSCDGNGNYFMLDTAGLPQERYYRIEVRSEQGGVVSTFILPLVFKISR